MIIPRLCDAICHPCNVASHVTISNTAQAIFTVLFFRIRKIRTQENKFENMFQIFFLDLDHKTSVTDFYKTHYNHWCTVAPLHLPILFVFELYYRIAPSWLLLLQQRLLTTLIFSSWAEAVADAPRRNAPLATARKSPLSKAHVGARHRRPIGL